MEFDSVANGKRIVDYFNSQEPFEVDGKLLLVDSAKNTYRTMWVGKHSVKNLSSFDVRFEEFLERQRYGFVTEKNNDELWKSLCNLLHCGH